MADFDLSDVPEGFFSGYALSHSSESREMSEESEDDESEESDDENLESEGELEDELKDNEEESCLVDEDNYEEKLKNFFDDPQSITKLRIANLESYKILTFVEFFGFDVKELELICSSIFASDLIDMLNLLPSLEKFTFDGNVEIYEGSKRQKIEISLTVPKLQKFHLTSNLQTLEIFTEILPENSIIEHSSCQKFGDVRLDYYTTVKNFFTKQNSIKKIITTDNEMSMLLPLLSNLQEIEINHDIYQPIGVDFCDIAKLPIKSLKIMKEINVPFFKEICKLKKLENLEIFSSVHCSDFNMLKKLKSLKKLRHHEGFLNFDMIDFYESSSPEWFSHQWKHLKELKLSGNRIDSVEVFKCFPNLKVLEIGTSLKLNSFAKFFPNLKNLKLEYSFDEVKHLKEICEHNSNIVSHNLKQLSVQLRSDDTIVYFWDFADELSAISEIYPSLKVLMLKIWECDDYEASSEERHKKKFENATEFFATINKMKHLKELKIESIPLRYLDRVESIAEELKELARNVDQISLNFEDTFELHENYWKMFSYRKLVDELQYHYDIVDNSVEKKIYLRDRIQDEKIFRLKIVSI